jgi:pilus assembly protein Flp/PilA
MTRFLRRLMSDSRGGTAIEYGLIAALIVMACVGALNGVANKTIGVWNYVSDAANRA